MYLADEIVRDPADVNADRYTTSNAIYQCSKLPREEWDGFVEWLVDCEIKPMGIPPRARGATCRQTPQSVRS